jgi:hypothetical protein
MRSAFILTLLLASGVAQASLGGPESSVEQDRSAFSANRQSPDGHGSYTVHELDTPANAVLEFVSSGGAVFAVAWRGIAPPDLSQLLGTYYSEYSEALKSEPKRKGRAPRSIQATHVVVELFGHMRAIRGIVYMPSLMPSGVSPDDVQNALR